MFKKCLALFLIFILTVCMLSGCSETKKPEPETEAPTADPVVLTVVGSWPDCKALDAISSKFTEKYPNCTIVYEYLQDYYASLKKRMTGESPIDLFFTTNIQSDSELLPYALDLNSCEGLDLSGTFDGLIENFTFREEDSTQAKKLYAIPVGSEMRGLYVNKTLLSSLGLGIPTDQASLLNACKVLKENGYIPFHGNPGNFAQTLLYPWICNLISNADDPQAAYSKVDSREAGVSELFNEPFEFLYSLVENKYYDYKTAQTEYNLFNETTDEDYARYFFNIETKDGEFVKADDKGIVAFMPSPISLKSLMDKTKDDYHSNIDYTFISAPVGKDGGFVYLSPAHGIAANKNSANQEWAVKFLDFLFTPENNEIFTETFNVLPNTENSYSYIKELYNVPNNHISHLGQVTFSYGFYDLITPILVDVSKANNPKYMVDDGNGNLTLYPLDYYMNTLENSFQQK